MQPLYNAMAAAAKPERMMSLPPSVTAVWVWPLVHVTMCALLPALHTLSQLHRKHAQRCLLTVPFPEGPFDSALIFVFTSSQISDSKHFPSSVPCPVAGSVSVYFQKGKPARLDDLPPVDVATCTASGKKRGN